MIATSLFSPKLVSELIQRHLQACLIKSKPCLNKNGERLLLSRLIRLTNLQGSKIRFQIVGMLDLSHFVVYGMIQIHKYTSLIKNCKKIAFMNSFSVSQSDCNLSSLTQICEWIDSAPSRGMFDKEQALPQHKWKMFFSQTGQTYQLAGRQDQILIGCWMMPFFSFMTWYKFIRKQVSFSMYNINIFWSSLGGIFGKNAFSDISFFWPRDQESILGNMNFQNLIFVKWSNVHCTYFPWLCTCKDNCELK